MEYIPLVSVGDVPSQDPAHPPTYWWGVTAGETALVLWEHCSGAAKSPLGVLPAMQSTAPGELTREHELHAGQTQHAELTVPTPCQKALYTYEEEFMWN